MKVALPSSWQLLAVPYSAAGAVAAWLIAWALIAASGREDIDGIRWIAPLLSPPILSPPIYATPARARTINRATLPRAPRERSAEERLAASVDLLEFIESIRRHPVPGGHYLALKAYDFCTREARLTLDALSGGHEESFAAAGGRQVEAQATLARLCGTFSQRNLATLDYYLLAEEGLQAQDSRLLTARRLERLSAQWDTTSRDDGPTRQALITDVLTGADGWMIRDLAGEFEVILHTGQLTIGGEPVAPAESFDVIQALWIMACEHGAACGREGEWQRLLACASAGECSTAPAYIDGNALRWRNRIRQALLAGPGAIDIVPMAEQRF